MKKIGHWNLNSFENKSTDLDLFLRDNNIDIMCLNERKASANIKFEISGYTLATRKECKTKSGGGCAILVKDYIDCREIELPEDDLCAITLQINRKLMCIVSSYCSKYKTRTGYTQGATQRIPTLHNPGRLQRTP